MCTRNKKRPSWNQTSILLLCRESANHSFTVQPSLIVIYDNNMCIWGVCFFFSSSSLCLCVDWRAGPQVLSVSVSMWCELSVSSNETELQAVISLCVNVKWLNVNSTQHEEGQPFKGWLCVYLTKSIITMSPHSSIIQHLCACLWV